MPFFDVCYFVLCIAKTPLLLKLHHLYKYDLHKVILII